MLPPLLTETVVRPHSKAVVTVKYSPDCSLIAAASADLSASVLRSSNGQISAKLNGGHTLGLTDCAWLTNGCLATSSDDKTIQLWDIEMREPLGALLGHNSFVYCLTTNPYNHVVYSGGYDGCIMIHDPSIQMKVASFVGHDDPISSIDASVNGYDIATGSNDNLVRIWDTRFTGACKYTLPNPNNSAVSCVRYSENGRFLVVSTQDGTHRLHALDATGAFNSNIASHIDSPNITSCNMKLVKEFTGHTNASFTITAGLWSLPFGDFLISGCETGKVCLWDINGEGPIVGLSAIIQGHSDISFSVDCNCATGQIASCGKDDVIRLWDWDLTSASVADENDDDCTAADNENGGKSMDVFPLPGEVPILGSNESHDISTLQVTQNGNDEDANMSIE